MMLTNIGRWRSVVAAHIRSATSYIAGRFSSGSPPKNVSTSLPGRIRSSSRVIHAITCRAVSIDIFSARAL